MGAHPLPQHEQTGTTCALATAVVDSRPPALRTEMLAHDLCNYLTAISGMAQVARLVGAAQEKDAYLCRIEAAVQEMSFILRDVLVDHISDPREAIGPAAMRQLLLDSMTLLEPRYQNKGVNLKLKCSTGLPPVRLASLPFKQVVVNLLDNALHFTPPGGLVQVTATCSRRPTAAVIKVQDNGTGMPKDVQARVWHPGFTTRTDGYGLGLPVAREIVEVQHGGQLTLRSRPGDGTTVRIYLPC
jgi:signal transduction histidine kinase